MSKIVVDNKYCKGCGLCVSVCPKEILELDTSAITAKGYHPIKVTNEDECIACQSCSIMCPDVALQVVR